MSTIASDFREACMAITHEAMLSNPRLSTPEALASVVREAFRGSESHLWALTCAFEHALKVADKEEADQADLGYVPD
jgi:hypothetical protein